MDTFKFNRLDMSSVDGTQLNMEALYRIAPSVFTEALDPKTGKVSRKVDFEALRQLLGDNAFDGGGESYQFTWVGKNAAKAEAARPTDKTLRPVPEDSVDWDNTKNLYIEGDNLEVLKLLQRSYLGRVKMIYIDPPYNTGNDFVYDDDFARTADEEERAAGDVDEFGNRYRKNTDSNGRFHSDWCSMIYPRLLVARSLLAEDGVIFISIDDHELENLRKICDEIFGESNFISCFAWVNSLKEELDEDIKFAGSNLGVLKKAHEYVLTYGKSSYKLTLDLPSTKYIEKLITKGGNNITDLFIPKGIHCSENISKTIKGHVGGTDDYYEIITKEGMIIKDGILQNDVLIRGPLGNAQMLSLFFQGETIFDSKGQKLLEVYIAPNGMLHTKKLRAGDTPSTVIIGKGTTKNGTLLLKKMFGKKVFDYSKPVELINYLLSKHKDNDFIVLDFFSGSGTTAHSVFLSNCSMEKTIKFILVQIPEKIDPELASSPKQRAMLQDAVDILMKDNHPANICELGKERIRRAGKKIKAESPLTTQDLDTGFRVFRLDESNYEEVAKSPKEYSQDTLNLFENNIKADRNDLDLLFGAMLAWGVTLDLPMTTETVDGCTVYTVNEGDLVACFTEGITDQVVTAMAGKMPLRVLFRDACFKQDDQKINIYEQFKQLMNWTDDEAFKNIRVI